MGWSDNDAGLWGDLPADAFGDALAAISASSIHATGRPPDGAAVLGSLLAALNYDSSREPFFNGPKRLAELRIRRGEDVVAVRPTANMTVFVEAFYSALDATAEMYRGVAKRPPTLPEVLQYLDLYFSGDDREHTIADPGGWDLLTVEFVSSSTRKPANRPEAPTPNVAAGSRGRRVTHVKFGPGTVQRDLGDVVEVQFEDGVTRKLRRNFLTFEEDA